MDARITLQQDESFLQILTELMQQGNPTAVLYDHQGPTRAEGMITEIQANKHPAYFVLENSMQIDIHTLIAVNGIFRSDYSEC